MTAVLWLCLTVSGANALALEMLWMRSAGLVLGQTASTTATVLACYFAGLALGAAAVRNLRIQPVRAYALLEIAAAAGALWSYAVLHLLALGPAAAALVATRVGGILAVAIALLPATISFGATLPAVGQALIGSGNLGRRSAILYALNTFGGAAGIAAGAIMLPLWVGTAGSYLLIAVTGMVVAALALVAIPIAPTSTATLNSVVAPRTVSLARLRIVAAAAGGVGLGLEVLWTRLFAQVLHNSVYSFGAIALVFIVALAAGAAVAGLLLTRAAPTMVAAGALLTGAVGVVGGFWLFVYLTDGLAYVGMQSGLAEYFGRIVVLASLTAGPAAFASGIILPALWAAWGPASAAARPLGDLSAANTGGAIVGALAGGFVAMPHLGVHTTLLLVVIIDIILANIVAPRGGRLRLVSFAIVLAALLFNPRHAPITHLRNSTETLRETRQGANGIVSVVESGGDLQLRLDNYYVLGGSDAAVQERRLGLIPLLLHPNPQHVAFVGLATGITASAAVALDVERILVAELVPEVAQAARTHFATWNGGVLERPNVQLVLDDGRRYLTFSNEHFDVIVSDLFVPWHAGAGSLYAREMYEAVARRLAPDGLFCQWLPLYQLTRAELDIIVRTMLTVFPRVTLWRADFYADRPVVGLIGQISPWSADLTLAADRVDRLPVWSRDPLLAAPRGLAMLYGGDLSAATALFPGLEVNTDDRPLIEFQAPRLTRINAAGDKDWFVGEPLATFYDELEALTGSAPHPLMPTSKATMTARHAGTQLYRYALAATTGRPTRAAELQAEVQHMIPDIISVAEATQANSDLVSAQHALKELRSEQDSMQQQIEDLQRRLGQIPPAQESP